VLFLSSVLKRFFSNRFFLVQHGGNFQFLEEEEEEEEEEGKEVEHPSELLALVVVVVVFIATEGDGITNELVEMMGMFTFVSLSLSLSL